MPQPTRFWRFSYDSEELVVKMLHEGVIAAPLIGPNSEKYSPERCIEANVKVGDGVILGKLDPDLGMGRIVAIGIVRAARPVTKVDWKRLKRDVYPSPQGGIGAWRERCFLFNKGPAERYNLAGDFTYQFPDE